MHLEENGYSTTYPLSLTAYLRKEALRGDTLDHTDEGCDVLDLIRLERTYEVPDDVGIALTQTLPLIYELLHTALTEDALPCLVGHLDIGGRVELRYRHEPSTRRQALLDRCKTLGDILTAEGLHSGRRLGSAYR